MTPKPPPTRFVRADAALRTFGARAQVFGDAMWRTDPLAEAVVSAFSAMPPGKGRRMLDRALDEGIGKVRGAPRALAALLEQAQNPPFWVDFDQIDRGGRVMLRAGFAGLLALGGGSLPLTYVPPAANKVLAFSRRLVEMAPRRILDTMRFHYYSCAPGAMRPGGEGFKTTLRVRLVHAQMRRVLYASERWNDASWGAPINQADMAYANVLFSVYPLDWLRAMGVRFTAEESDAAMQLWRWSAHVMGVDPALAPATEAEAKRLGALYEMTTDTPDDDSRALVNALATAGEKILRAYAARASEPLAAKLAPLLPDMITSVIRFFVGPERAAHLGLPETGNRAIVPLLRALIAQSEVIRSRSARADDLALRVGDFMERALFEGGVPGEHGGAQKGTIEAVLGAQRER